MRDLKVFLAGALFSFGIFWTWFKPYNYCPDPKTLESSFSFMAQNEPGGKLFYCYKSANTFMEHMLKELKGENK